MQDSRHTHTQNGKTKMIRKVPFCGLRKCQVHSSVPLCVLPRKPLADVITTLHHTVNDYPKRSFIYQFSVSLYCVNIS